ncbi:PREDICTED: uncharacterized protein LOC105460738, partial [Wasmannia auropunctata]|uniref:uncharacterized protein LOC105460738 n=1 Tax=Wasmannia auropunctata TaxID=64793 RepID=UPI0005EF4DBD
SFVPTAAKVKTATIDTTAAKTATITNDNTNVGITANANTTNIATIDANTATATNANVATAIDIANIHTVDSRECDETERRAQEDTIVPTTAAANTATIINIDPTIANADIIDTATANTDIVTIDTAEDERSVEESEEEESDDFMLVLSENNSVHFRQSALSNTTKSINEHSDNDFLKDKQKLLRAFRTAKKQDKGSKFVTTLCNVLWTREELAERCVKQSRICERRLLSPVKVKFIRSKFLNWIKQKDKNVHKEQRAFSVYLSRAIFTARLKYLRAQRRKR